MRDLFSHERSGQDLSKPAVPGVAAAQRGMRLQQAWQGGREQEWSQARDAAAW